MVTPASLSACIPSILHGEPSGYQIEASGTCKGFPSKMRPLKGLCWLWEAMCLVRPELLKLLFSRRNAQRQYSKCSCSSKRAFGFMITLSPPNSLINAKPSLSHRKQLPCSGNAFLWPPEGQCKQSTLRFSLDASPQMSILPISTGLLTSDQPAVP